MLKALEKHLRKSIHSLKEKLIIHLKELVLSDPTQDTLADSSTDWINLIDHRGFTIAS